MPDLSRAFAARPPRGSPAVHGSGELFAISEVTQRFPAVGPVGGGSARPWLVHAVFPSVEEPGPSGSG